MDKIRRRKFNNLYWTYTVVAICMLLMSKFQFEQILSIYIFITGITFVYFDERGKELFPDPDEKE